jgi:hypothetical protein
MIRLFLLLALLLCAPIQLDCALMPNRGKQLFVWITDKRGVNVTVMTPPKREVLGEWNCCNPMYDFVSAVVERVKKGSKVRFTRHVMQDDYVPKTETLELFFPYAKQARYAFFDIGTITGFYRNSVTDFDLHEIVPSVPQS